MWGDRPLPIHEGRRAERMPDKAQPQVRRCTNDGLPVGPTLR